MCQQDYKYQNPIFSMRKLIAANWKLFYTREQLTKIAHLRPTEQLEVVVAPPFPYIIEARRILPDFISVCAQNVCPYETGVFTGEVTSKMIKSINCDTVIIGHSERRTYFQETDVDIKNKLISCLNQNLRVILCVGEALNMRQLRFDALLEQLNVLEDGQSVIIAYEPVWCIGTGIIPRNDEIREIVVFIKDRCMKMGVECRVLYGGSVTSRNVGLLNEIEELDGYLIGGAATTDDLITIIEMCDRDKDGEYYR